MGNLVGNVAGNVGNIVLKSPEMLQEMLQKCCGNAQVLSLAMVNWSKGLFIQGWARFAEIASELTKAWSSGATEF